MSEKFKIQFKESISGLIGGVSVNKLGKFVIPLPPLAEQHRIVQQIESYFAAFDQIENELA
jgi:type I restriction modification DNA specificity domain protein